MLHSIARAVGLMRPASLFVVVVALVVPVLVASPAGAAGKVRVGVSRSVSASTVLTGDAVTVTGRVSAGKTGTVVALQRHQRGRWSTLVRTRLTAARTYRISFAGTVASNLRYRVVSRGSSTHRTGTSASFGLRYLACTRMKAPSGGRAAWFTRPGARGTNQLTTGIARLFCSASRGATINVSMYYIRAGRTQADIEKMLDALTLVSRYRGVKVRILLEGRLYRPGTSLRPTLGVLKKFATVVQCQLGCRNEQFQAEAKGAIMHHKFITVSDLTLSAATDPAVVMSSANWSQSQVRQHWQSAVLVYRDAALHREVDTQFRVLDTCAGQGGCASWAAALTRLSLPRERHGMTAANRVWHDTSEGERSGDLGSGLGVTFFPWAGPDPVADALNGYACTPEHRTVRVAHMFLSTRKRVVQALAGLQDSGCDVDVVLTRRPPEKLAAGLTLLADHGVDVTCAPRLHDKAIVVDAVRRADGRPDKTVLMGSHSLGYSAIRRNDESMMRVSTYAASGQAVAGNAAVWRGFSRHWSAIRGTARRC